MAKYLEYQPIPPHENVSNLTRQNKELLLGNPATSKQTQQALANLNAGETTVDDRVYLESIGYDFKTPNGLY